MHLIVAFFIRLKEKSFLRNLIMYHETLPTIVLFSKIYK
jgi:hypothetical protein